MTNIPNPSGIVPRKKFCEASKLRKRRAPPNGGKEPVCKASMNDIVAAMRR